ncbi:MAG TPA: hypothetical protein DCE42_24185 [Myxococcales bacterium]|nr:hypothetical protein [Deltaproteobacteria bacterium]MBU51268.1 hypothetical protein [Deltaproteobacteria bacterium]HAA57886.1 hypothetical protein [Myxococcales bacterium]
MEVSDNRPSCRTPFLFGALDTKPQQENNLKAFQRPQLHTEYFQSDKSWDKTQTKFHLFPKMA